jgi:Hint module
MVTTKCCWLFALFLHSVFGQLATPDYLRRTQQVQPRDHKGKTVDINGDPTPRFSLDKLSADDPDTLPTFLFSGYIPRNANITCTMLTCQAEKETEFYIQIGQGAFYATANPKISTVKSSCPFSTSLVFTEETVGTVTVATRFAQATGITLRCTSPNFDGTGPDGFGGDFETDICFSEATTVEVKDKGTTLMKELQINDQVLVGSDKNNNRPIYEPIYGFGHHEKNTPHEYLQIHTAAQKEPLEMSAAHLLYVEGKEHPVRADSIQKGDILILQTLHSPATSVMVTKVTWVVRNGAYMPLTKSGSIVVNGILASSYVSIMKDAPEIVSKYLSVVSEDQLVHWWLAPYRMVCQGLPSLCEDDKDESGISHWLAFGRYLAQMANGWSFVGQTVGLVVVWLFMAFWMALEVLLGVFGNLPGVVGGLVLAIMMERFFLRAGNAQGRKKIE